MRLVTTALALCSLAGTASGACEVPELEHAEVQAPCVAGAEVPVGSACVWAAAERVFVCDGEDFGREVEGVCRGDGSFPEVRGCVAAPANDTDAHDGSGHGDGSHGGEGSHGSHGNVSGLHHSEDEEATKVGFYLISCVIIVAFVAVRLVQKLDKPWMSESGGVILIGVAIGALTFGIEKITGNDYENYIEFKESSFELFILPPIIFEAGFSLEHGGIMRNLGTILLFAVIGTLVSTVAIGCMLYWASESTLPELYEADGAMFICMAMGAMISAVDPVAVIAVLGQKFDLKYPPFLYNLVFGEAVLNDAVAIVVYDVMMEFVNENKALTFDEGCLAVVEFFKVSILSAILGYLYGCLCAFFLKHVNFKKHAEVEIILIGAFAMGSYYLAQVLHLSGIMALFICARIQGHHALWNCSQETRDQSHFIFKILAHVAEMYVFALLGEAAFHSQHSFNFGFMGVAFAAMLVARALNIFPLAALANCNRKRNKISGAVQFFMWFGGLRGAIAFGLALLTLSRAEERAAAGEEAGLTVEIARVFVSTIFAAVCFTVLIMGGFIDVILRRLGLDKPDRPQTEENRNIALLSMGEQEGGQEVVHIDQAEIDRAERRAFKKSRAIMRRLAKFDETHIAPWLRSDVVYLDDDDDEEMVDAFGGGARDSYVAPSPSPLGQSGTLGVALEAE